MHDMTKEGKMTRLDHPLYMYSTKNYKTKWVQGLNSSFGNNLSIIIEKGIFPFKIFLSLGVFFIFK